MAALNYDEVHEFIRHWSTAPANPPYDLVGVVHLFAAALDNLRYHVMQHEKTEIREILDNKKREFLHSILTASAIDNLE